MKPVTLTFDNGPTPGVTERVLDILARHRVRATFFVVGAKVRASEHAAALVQRAAAAGHWIGNHTDTHSVPFGRLERQEDACLELDRAQQALGDAVHPDRLFRPFGGGGRLGPDLFNPPVLERLRREKYTCVLWNAVPRDWPGEDDIHESWVERAREQVRARDWPLLVLHDIEGACLERLDGFLAWLKREKCDIRQEFPDDCVVIRRGVPRPGTDLRALTAADRR